MPLPRPCTSWQSHATTTRLVHNNIIAQLELLGMPYSTGVEPGQGLRLVLGSDYLGIPGMTPGGAPVNTTTRWLMPASATAFDPRCKRAGLDEALADGCALLGERAAAAAPNSAPVSYSTSSRPLARAANLARTCGHRRLHRPPRVAPPLRRNSVHHTPAQLLPMLRWIHTQAHTAPTAPRAVGATCHKRPHTQH